MPATWHDPRTGETLVRVQMDGIVKKCGRCKAKHCYWRGGKCQICALHDERQRARRWHGKTWIGRSDNEPD